MFILKRKHYYCSKKIQMSWLYCSISTASLAEEEGWPKTKDGKALLHGARDSFLLKIAFGSVSVCWWWLSSSGMLPARRCCSGVLQLFCCWTLPPGGSCTLLLSPGTRPPVCCHALLNSAPKDCLKPKLNAHKTKKAPNQPKRSHHHGTAVSYFPFWTRWAALWGEKEVLTAEFMRSSHPIVLIKLRNTLSPMTGEITTWPCASRTPIVTLRSIFREMNCALEGFYVGTFYLFSSPARRCFTEWWIG